MAPQPFIDHDVVDAMAVTLTQAAVDLDDEVETAIVLAEAGYDDRQIASHRPLAVMSARIARQVADICAGRTERLNSGEHSHG